MPVLPNPRHEGFCQERARGKSMIAAYRAAGYRGARYAASQLAAKAHIQARMLEIMGKGAERAEIDAESVLRELGRIGFANMLDYMTISSDGRPVVDLSRITREKAAALAPEVVVEYLKDGRNEHTSEVRRIKFKLQDKQAALVNIGKYLGLFVERHEHSGKDGAPVEVDKISNRELAKAVAEILSDALDEAQD